MQSKLKRALAGVAALASVATVVPLFAASPAGAVSPAGDKGTLTMNPASGTSASTFTLGFGANPTDCPGDSSTGGYRWSTFMVPSTTDLATMTWNSTGPVGGQALISTAGDAIVSQNTDITTGNISGVPQFTWQYNSPTDFPAGTYKLGIACTLGTATQSWWSKTVTVTTNAATGGPAEFDWAQGAVPAAPVITTVTPGDGSLTVAFTPPAADPAVTGYTLTATPQTGGGSPVSMTGTGSPITINTGLTNGIVYDLSLTATNTAGTGTAATSTGTPAKPALSAPVVTATPAIEGLNLSWTPAGGSPTGYTVTLAPDPLAGPFSQTVTGTSLAITGLTSGTSYTATVTAIYADPTDVAGPGTATATPLGTGILVQNITATRPAGALVLTQDCLADPTCTVNLTTGALDASGTYYTATGTLYELTVTDTRDVDAGWSVKGDLADTFTTTGDSFNSRAMGWAPNVTYDAPAAPDGYDPNPVAGVTIAPNTSNDIKDGIAVLFSAPSGAGLGVARATAGITLQIPVSAQAGVYTAQLAISVS